MQLKYWGLLVGFTLPLTPAWAALQNQPLSPVFVRPAQVVDHLTLDFRVEKFDDKPMQEISDFDGYGLALDISLPLGQRSQLQMLIPAYTNGDGRYNVPGEGGHNIPIDVDGYGGVEDFWSLVYQQRWAWLESISGANAAWSAGFGRRTNRLIVEYQGVEIDRFNHRGYNVQLGLQFDDYLAQSHWQWMANAHWFTYWDTDDLNWMDGDDAFSLINISGAILWHGLGNWVPAIELIAESNFDRYTSVHIVPELLVSATRHLDIKLGAPLRIGDDGQKFAVDLELTYQF